ncbi:MAG: PASTA domain-containing protein [candidate division Zixibacteria bacterium]|nr:PASTA domain-containing protein [candidate division Zixibacteria bacterium]
MRNLKETISWENIKRGIIILSISIVLLVIFILFTDTVVMPFVVKHGVESIVPEVTEIHLEAAKRILSDNGFKHEVTSEEFSPTKPRFTVLSQQPEPGLTVKSGRTIGLVVSRGGEIGLVPELRGLTLRQAKLMLEEDGFEPGLVTYEHDDRLPADVIIRSYPPSGAQIDRGGIVDLVINLRQGAILVLVPDYIGMDFSSVESDIYEIGLTIADLEYVESDSVLPETILSQSLVAGMEVQEGTQISFTISKMRDN